MSSGVRILGGLFRGRKLSVPSTARPTESRVREALMNRWSPRLGEARFLDAFAGSGAVGAEALGRGAERVTWVEKQGRAGRELRRTMKQWCREAELPSSAIEVLGLDLPKASHRLVGPYDLIFADPPYATDALVGVVEALLAVLADEGEMALEHETRRPAPAPPDGFEIADQRRYGDTGLTFYRHLGQS